MIPPMYSLTAVHLAQQSLHGPRLAAINRDSLALSLQIADAPADLRAKLLKRYAALRDEYTAIVLPYQAMLDGEGGQRGQRTHTRHLVSH